MYLSNIKTNSETLSSYPELVFLFKNTSYFMLGLYFYLLLQKSISKKIYDKNSIGLVFIYIKYILNIIINSNIKLVEYEISRVIMWVFTTPLMLKMVSDENELSLKDFNIHYHFLAILPHVFCIPFKNTVIYTSSSIVLSIPGLFFLKSLHKYKNLKFINTLITIWTIFMIINLTDIIGILDDITIHALYNIADTVFKFTFNFIISDINESNMTNNENIDLQSINFVSNIISCISKFQKNNTKLTPYCNDLIKHSKKNFIEKIPKSNSRLKLELLKKLLPFNFDKDFISANYLDDSNSNSITDTSINKNFKMICVMFMDIVDYTELAKKYNEDIIFKLLNNIYIHFDTIIKKYSHLQKIETIGDAYMVVGDIFREDEINHKVVIKEMILLAFDFIRDIKTIKTPDNKELSIRIGLNIGPVHIGILGNENPRLCVVGNTVNIAARLQSTSEPNNIQMSRHIYEQLTEIDVGMELKFIVKENVFLKNIGCVTTYNINSDSIRQM